MDSSIQGVLSRLDSAATDGRKFQLLLIGSSEDILEAMHTLQALRGKGEDGQFLELVVNVFSTFMKRFRMAPCY